MSNFWIHPALIMLVGGALLPLIPERVKKGYLLAVPLLAFARIFSMQWDFGMHGELHFAQWTLTFGRVDALSQVFGYIMGLMCIIGTLYGLHVKRNAEHIAAWFYVAGSMGAIYAGDFITLFLFWELMAIASTFLIWFRGEARSLGAGFRYLLVHMAGGVALLAGIMLHYKATHSLAFVKLDVDAPTLSTYLIMTGFILNAAVPPLHAWLPDAYSSATFNGSVFMCAFTTKTAVYALARGLPGMHILVPLGVFMAVAGAIYAVLQDDSRRLLAYHVISQVGYMVAGVGIGTALAINGACAHAFAHILYKGLLFMGCGTVLHITGETRFSQLGGLYKKMPWTFVLTLIGGLSISAFPFFSGFVSKSMIVSAGFEQHTFWAGFLLLLASSGTFLSTTLKIPYFIWFGKNRCTPQVWEKAKDPNWNMTAAMAFTAFLCVFIGCYTPYLYRMLPYPEEAANFFPYTAFHISETMQILLFTALGFFLLIKKMEPHAGLCLDLDWVYRKGGEAFFWFARRPVQAIDTFVGEVYSRVGLSGLMDSARSVGEFDNDVIDGAVDGFAGGIRRLGASLRFLQRGAVQQNLAMAFAVAAVLGLVTIFIF
ncbi:MAG: Na(+)/H(+) antiporter subunit D [Opitutaceae bacterium]|jgi:multicomponent Na+:H+ antiporter subunit D